jgi:ion channel-forming bestrophin family protein
MIDYNNKEWLRQLFAWNGTIVKSVASRVVFFMAWTAVIILLYDHAVISKNIKIDMVVYNVVGLALGLLLVFRTNTSYDRYWEGRRLMGAVVNDSRNLALTLNGMVAKTDAATRKKLADLIAAFSYAAKERLREGVERKHLPCLIEELKDEVMKKAHVPNAIMRVLHEEIARIKIPEGEKAATLISINTELSGLINNLGGMERIRSTPVPFAYAAHLQMFIMLYFLAFPFGLYDKFHWLSIPVVGLISLILLGINEIGVEIEDPFGNDPNDLPMDKLCENIEKNVGEILLSA